MPPNQNNYNVKARISPDGKGLSFLHAEALAIEFLPSQNEDVDVTLIFGKVKRSLAQNRWLWGVAYVVIRHEMREKFGDDMPAEVIHAHNLQIIQGVQLNWSTINGREVLVVDDKKSSNMSVEEFSSLVEKLVDWYAINKDIIIPLPEGDNTINEHIKYK